MSQFFRRSGSRFPGQLLTRRRPGSRCNRGSTSLAGQLLLSELNHPADHVAANSTTLAGRQVAPVPVGGRGDTHLAGRLILKVIQRLFSAPDEDAIGLLTLGHGRSPPSYALLLRPAFPLYWKWITKIDAGHRFTRRRLRIYPVRPRSRGTIRPRIRGRRSSFRPLRPDPPRPAPWPCGGRRGSGRRRPAGAGRR